MLNKRIKNGLEAERKTLCKQYRALDKEHKILVAKMGDIKDAMWDIYNQLEPIEVILFVPVQNRMTSPKFV